MDPAPDRDPKREAESLKQALADALEQQAATSEILRVISSSLTDVHPVFAALLTSAARLCDAFDGTIFQVDGDGSVSLLTKVRFHRTRSARFL